MNKTKIILVDDKAVYRNAMKTLLNKIGGSEVIGEASSGQEFLYMIERHTPDLVFMDIEMPNLNGIDTTKIALQRKPDLTIIGLSMYNEDSYIDQLLKAGARGYLLKLSDNHNLLQAIIKNPRAEIFFSKEIDMERKTDARNAKKIMIADDFEHTRSIVEFTLTNAGYEVIQAVDGNDAYEKLKKNKVDLIISDYNMPGMNGLELSQKVKQLPEYQSTPILLLTTEVDPQKRTIAKTLGLTGWIQKPFKVDSFLETIAKLLK
jgi:two-component system, chemotaxis family, chemotaxis protein CheY